MADPFFLSGPGAKRKRPATAAATATAKPTAAKAKKAVGKPNATDRRRTGGARKAVDEELDDEDDDDDDENGGRGAKGSADLDDGAGDVEDRETAAEKRVRLARQYLDTLARPRLVDGDGNADSDGGDDDDDNRDAVATRLLQDVLPPTIDANAPAAVFFRGHELAVTAAALSDDERFVYTTSKEGHIAKWNIVERKREWIIRAASRGAPASTDGHTDHVLALAVTSDGKFLASAGRDTVVRIWDTAQGTHVHAFRQHRGAVTGLAFRRGTYQLFSASDDRTVKVWEVGERAYVETLFGHQEGVTSIDALSRERCVTAGGRDRTVRLWKIPEESQLVYRGQAASMDTVRWVADDCFVSGDDLGTVSVWDINKKKPTATVPNAHGPGRWICAVAALPYSDLVASGSSDGIVRFWKVAANRRALTPVATCAVPGFVNALAFSPNGRLLIVAVGQEHRLGRWERITSTKNGVHVIPLPLDRERASKQAVQPFKATAVPRELAVVPPPAQPMATSEPAPRASKVGSGARAHRGGGGGGKRPPGRGPKARARQAAQ